MNAYHSHFPISPPEADLDARLALYSLRRYCSSIPKVHDKYEFPSFSNQTSQLSPRKHSVRFGREA